MKNLIENIAENTNVTASDVAAVLAFMHSEGFIDYGVVREANGQVVG